jgi:hypothetical protein
MIEDDGVQQPVIRPCQCESPSWGICTPTAITNEGTRLLEANRPFIYKFVCFDCGGVARSIPENYDHINGETVIRRLVQLGLAVSAG